MFVHDLNQFVTVQLLEETPAVLSPGKLCKDHGRSCKWVSRAKLKELGQAASDMETDAVLRKEDITDIRWKRRSEYRSHQQN